VVDALKNLRLEIDALRIALRSGRRANVTDKPTLERIRELFLSWSNFRAQLATFEIPVEVINRVDHLFTDLVRLTTSRSPRSRYMRALFAIRQSLTEQLLLEIARAAEFRPARRASARVEGLIPEIPDIGNELIPNALFGWKDNIRHFLQQSSFDLNVFIMVAYRPRLRGVISSVRKALEELGLNPVLANEHRLTDDLYNPIACLLCCGYGVAIFDRGEIGQVHNSNIVYELATMQLLKRPCVILKHKSLRAMPSDFLHRLYEGYRTAADASERVENWWRTTSRENEEN
jgi:hypothetical protein